MLTRRMIEDYQLKKLQETVHLAMTKSSFYRRHLGHVDVESLTSLDQLRELPFTSAKDLRDNPLQFVCCSQDDIERIITLESSGTTGLPKRVFFTKADQELTKDFFHHALGVVAQPGDRVLVLLPGEREGSVGQLFAEGARRMNVVPVQHGLIQDVEATLRVMEQEAIDTLLGTPTQVLALASYEPPGEHQFRIHIKNVILNTDHLPRAVTDRIRDKWGCRVFNHYAMTEMGLGGGIECEAMAGYHMREADLLFEIVDPVTGNVLDDGDEGEVVFTTLTRQGMPLIRYRTGDIGRFIPEPCPCGTVLKRMAPVKDRLDGRIPLGTNGYISMSMLDEVLFDINGILDFRVLLSRHRDTDDLHLEVSCASWVDEDISRVITRALLSIPVVRKNVESHRLALCTPYVERQGAVWPAVKRIIKTKVAKERR